MDVKKQSTDNTVDKMSAVSGSNSPGQWKKKGKGGKCDFDWPKKSYLEVSRNDPVSDKLKCQIHRLVYISKLKDENFDRSEVGNHYEKHLKKLQEDFQSEPATGLMLIYMKHIVHVLESSSETLLKVIRFVQQDLSSVDSFESVAKILIISHDIPSRMYQHWNFRVLDIEAHRMEAFEPSGTIDDLVVDVLTQLLKLGSYLSLQPKASVKNVLDCLHERIPEHLPQQAAVHYLLEQDDTCMLLPSELIEMYDNPFDVTLEGDLVWPVETKLFPYH